MVKKPTQDHVDLFLEEVRVRFPELDLRVEGIVDRIGGIHRRVKRMLDETLDEFELNAGEWHVLGALFRAPERRRSPGELSSNIELSSAAMTNRLDRLEKAGLVQRVPDSTDRRSVQVELTESGAAVYERAVGAQAVKESIVAAALEPRQQDQLNDLLRRLMLEFERRETKP